VVDVEEPVALAAALADAARLPVVLESKDDSPKTVSASPA